MIIAIDYDSGVYVEDYYLWDDVIKTVQGYKFHSICFITERSEDEPITFPHRNDVAPVHKDANIFYTDGQDKRQYMKDRGINVHVWMEYEEPEPMVRGQTGEYRKLGEWRGMERTGEERQKRHRDGQERTTGQARPQPN